MRNPIRKLLSAFLAIILIVSLIGTAAYAVPPYTVEAASYDSQAGTFVVTLYGVADTSLVKSVQFPVWSQPDQSDIVWYTAHLNGNGTYSTTVNLSKHGYNVGTYTVHCYVNFKSGNTEMVGDDTITVSGSTGYVSAFLYDGTYYAKLDGHTIPGVSKVRFPVWSIENGQDDLVWYTGTKQADGSYLAAINLANHKHLGDFAVHCYVTYNSGSQVFISATGFSAYGPYGGTVSITPLDATGGTYKAEVSGICNGASVKTVQFPVWCSEDRNDMVWYTASKEADGKYTAYIDYARHKYHAGTYNVHCYVTDICGNQYLAGGTNFTISDKSGTVSVTPGDEAGTYTVKLDGAIYSSGIRVVRFPVWSEANGQDDIVWYYGTKQADGVYAATIKLSNHKDFGVYNAHCYVTTNSGVQYLSGGTTFNVDQPAGGTLTVTPNGANSGSFHITFKSISNPYGIKKVQFPVWSDVNGQDDIIWYTANKESDGSFTCDVNYAKHGCQTGNYTIHAYVTDINGNMTLSAATNYNLNVSGTNIITATPIDADGSRMLITITNASAGGPISSMYFPTWSSINGQDDILWYKGTNVGGNTWQVTVSLSNHSSSGVFYTHAYANGSDLLGGITYNLSRSSDAKMNSRIAGRSSATPYLVAVDTTSNTVGVYQGSIGNWNLIQFWSCTTGAAATPTITGEFTIGSKGTSFSGANYTCWYYTSFSGNYMFHSVLYERGSQSQVRVGTLGAHLSDGCVRLALENARWLQNNVPAGSKVVIF